MHVPSPTREDKNLMQEASIGLQICAHNENATHPSPIALNAIHQEQFVREAAINLSSDHDRQSCNPFPLIGHQGL